MVEGIKKLMLLKHAGTQIEEPFATLPLDAYCEMMSRHAKEQYKRRKGDNLFSLTQTFSEFVECMLCLTLIPDHVLHEARYTSMTYKGRQSTVHWTCLKSGAPPPH